MADAQGHMVPPLTREPHHQGASEIQGAAPLQWMDLVPLSVTRSQCSLAYNLADVAWWVRDTCLGVALCSRFTSQGLGFLLCRMRSVMAWKLPSAWVVCVCAHTWGRDTCMRAHVSVQGGA